MTGFGKDEIFVRGHPVWAEVDLDAIRHNIRSLAGLAPGAEVMGVAKGYAYGHGNPASARAMVEAGATWIGVARVAEGFHLRDAGLEVPILVFTEPPADAVRTMLEYALTPGVYTGAFARALSDAAVSAGRRVPIHVKLDTGMHRVGLVADDVPGAIREMTSLPGIQIEGVWSHLAVADVPDHPFTTAQIELFERILDLIVRAGVDLKYRHIANSAATMTRSDAHFDMVRCGIASYGLWPGERLAGAADLRPALALRARASMVKEVPAGDRLSYGLEYELPAAGRVVTVPAGYADGYGRRLSGAAHVLIHGRRHRVSGTVCMDQFMVDVRDDEVEVGDIVTLIGADGDDCISADELAAQSGTINYEITARIPSRVPRLYLGEHRSSEQPPPQTVSDRPTPVPTYAYGAPGAAAPEDKGPARKDNGT